MDLNNAKIWLTGALIAASAFAAVFLPASALAGSIELSLGGSYNRSNYSDLSYTWSRRIGASVGYHFTEFSGVEFTAQDSLDRNRLVGFEDTTFHDQVYSVSWIQSFTGKHFPVQPYAKIGIGQLNREASGSYGNGATPPLIQDSVTGVLAAGLRLYLTNTFAIRGEANSYLTGGSVRTWQDNVGFTLGVSFIY